MNPEQYTRLRRIEETHWFYTAKRDLVRYWIERYIKLNKEDLLIDAGTGTGTLLVEMSGRCRLLGLDDFEESVLLARPRVESLGGQVLKADLTAVDLPDGAASVVTLLDVLEHVVEDKAALQEMIRLTRPGGLLVVTVPALPVLWSDWDEVLHHKRRYTWHGFKSLITNPQVQVLQCKYVNSILLPAILMVRAFRKLRPPPPDALRAEDCVPPKWINRCCYYSMLLPGKWNWCRPPVGVSLLAVLRKSQP